jgi:hypothetical protein
MGFGSVRGLSQFTADEIAEMGFDIIWTAFEGVKSGYKKLRGAKLDHLYRKVTEEGRYLDVYQDKPDYRTFDGFSMHFKHASFKPKELEDRSTVIVDVDGRKLRFVPATRASSQGISPLILLLMRRSKSQRNVDIKT